MDDKMLSSEEDRIFTSYLLNMEKDKNSGEYSKAREYVNCLMYIIPRKVLLLDEDLSSELYIELLPKIDEIINAFRVSNLTFNHYLTQYMKFHLLDLLRKKRKEKLIDDIFIDLYKMDESTFISLDEERIDEGINSPTTDSDIHYNSYIKEEINNYTLFRSLFHDIADSKINTPKGKNDFEILFSDIVNTKNKLRDFLYFVLRMPRESDERMQTLLENMLSVERGKVREFFDFKNEWIGNKKDIYDESRRKANKNFVYLQRLKIAMSLEEDANKLRMLQENYNRVKRIKDRQYKKGLKKPKLTYDEISQKMGVSRSSVSNGVRKTIKNIKERTKGEWQG